MASSNNGSVKNGHSNNGNHSSNGNGHHCKPVLLNGNGNHHAVEALGEDTGMSLKLEANNSNTLSKRQFLLSVMQTRTLSHCLWLATDRGIANHVSRTSPTGVVELAKKLGYNADNLKRFMSYLASHGIFEELENGDFIGTELSDLIRDDVPGNCVNGLKWAGARPMTMALYEMEHSLKTGDSAFELANGAPVYDYLTAHPEHESMFDRAMPNYHQQIAASVAYKFDFTHYSKVVELGGGRGFFLKEILSRFPNVSEATLFERKTVERNVLPELKQDLAFSNRFRFVAGDFLEQVDCDGELFAIINTMHNFNDDDSVRILSNVAKAMARNGSASPDCRLLIVEYDTYCYGANEPANLARALDLMMMYAFKGKQRNESMWRLLLPRANLQLADDGKSIMRLPPMFTAYECKLLC